MRLGVDRFQLKPVLYPIQALLKKYRMDCRQRRCLVDLWEPAVTCQRVLLLSTEDDLPLDHLL